MLGFVSIFVVCHTNPEKVDHNQKCKWFFFSLECGSIKIELNRRSQCDHHTFNNKDWNPSATVAWMESPHQASNYHKYSATVSSIRSSRICLLSSVFECWSETMTAKRYARIRNKSYTIYGGWICFGTNLFVQIQMVAGKIKNFCLVRIVYAWNCLFFIKWTKN